MTSPRRSRPSPAKVHRECRYSCEMMYLELKENGVRYYLGRSPHHADHWSFEEVIGGGIDKTVVNLFSDEDIQEVKAAVQQRLTKPARNEEPA